MKILEILILDILRKLDIFGLRYAAYFCQTSRVDMTMSKIPEKKQLWLYHNTPEHILNHLMVSNGTDLLGKPILNVYV